MTFCPSMGTPQRASRRVGDGQRLDVVAERQAGARCSERKDAAPRTRPSPPPGRPGRVTTNSESPVSHAHGSGGHGRRALSISANEGVLGPVAGRVHGGITTLPSASSQPCSNASARLLGARLRGGCGCASTVCGRQAAVDGRRGEEWLCVCGFALSRTDRFIAPSLQVLVDIQAAGLDDRHDAASSSRRDTTRSRGPLAAPWGGRSHGRAYVNRPEAEVIDRLARAGRHVEVAAPPDRLDVVEQSARGEPAVLDVANWRWIVLVTAKAEIAAPSFHHERGGTALIRGGGAPRPACLPALSMAVAR